AVLCLIIRIATALHLQSKLLRGQTTTGPRAVLGSQRPRNRDEAGIYSAPPLIPDPLRAQDGSRSGDDQGITFFSWWLVPLKDLWQAAVWLLAFTGNRIEWRGEQMQLRRDGTLKKLNK
ncbi:MAG: hypothetical protein QOJ40_1782, partial [Verrucomicrobiota bacterium]